MRLNHSRIASAVTAAAVILSTTGLASVALADSGGPTVSLTSSIASGATTTAATIPVTATFSEAVTGFTSSDVTVSNGTVSNFAGSGASYTFDVAPTADGTVTIAVPEDAAQATAAPHKHNETSNTLVYTHSTADVTAPIISDVSVMPSATSTIISWTTDEATQGQVSYGLTAGYGSTTTLESTASTTHSVTITGLTASTLYHFQISATDASANTATTTDDTFTTLGALAAPTISNVAVSGIGSTTATVTWTTDLAASSQVFYGLTSGYSSSTTLDTTASTSHSVMLSGLSASTTYHFQVASANGIGTTTSADSTFTTTSGTTTPGAPTVSGIAVTGIGTSTATVTWNTADASSTQLMYGTTTAYGSSSMLDTGTSTAHSVSLTGLDEATLYHFQIVATNGTGTTTSADHTLTTLSTSSSTPLAVDSIDAIKTDATADDTFLHGWEWIMHLTVPDLENAFRMKFSDFTGTATIPAANNIRIYSPQSTNATSTATAIYSTDNDYGDWLYLSDDTSTTTPGRQIDVDIQVKVPSGTPNGSYSTTYGAQSVPSTATSTTP